MSLFIWNMKFHFSHTVSEGISNNVMGCSLFLTMEQQRTWVSIGSRSWSQMQQNNPKVEGWKTSNLMCNAKDKTYETKQKDEMTN